MQTRLPILRSLRHFSSGLRLQKGSRLEVTIEKLDLKGRGVAQVPQLKNKTIAIAGALPGQIVEATISKLGKDPTGRLNEVVKDIAESATPKCSAYFGTCGGCMHQHYRYEAQLQQKQAHVQELLGRFCDVSPIVGVENAQGIYNYRNKMEFSCSDREFLIQPPTEELGLSPALIVGLYPRTTGRWHGKVLSIEQCELQSPRANRIFAVARRSMKQAGLDAYNLRQNTGTLRSIVVRTGSTLAGDEEVMITLVTNNTNDPRLEDFAELIHDGLSLEDKKALVSIRSSLETGSARDASVAMVDRVLYGRDFIYDSIGNFEFRVSGNAFFQPNSKQAFHLYSRIKDKVNDVALDLGRKPIVWDLFCGTGSISIFIADAAEKVFGIELEPSAVKDACENARRNDVMNAEFKCADLSDVNAPETKAFIASLPTPDIVLFDPPRPGLHKRLIEVILAIKPQVLCYVSCNPVTQARDVEKLGHFYTAKSCVPVDMLPQTPHLETICTLELNA